MHHYLIPPNDPGLAAIRVNHVIHHGGIGHHVQNWYAYRCPYQLGRIAAVDCASRIALPAGGTMAEGWACYATDLMGEIGYLTPAERRDELATRRRMAARAVVDVRLHQGRFGFDEAVAYYQARAGMSHDAATQEVVKNSMFPGAAVIYLLGRDQIHQLRRAVAPRMPSLRAFHDALLHHGSIPVALAAREMKRVHGAQ